MSAQTRTAQYVCAYCGQRFYYEENRNRHEKQNKLDGKGCR